MAPLGAFNMITVDQLKARRQIKLQHALAFIEIEILKVEDSGLRELKVSVEQNSSEVEIAYVLKCAGDIPFVYVILMERKTGDSYLHITWT